MRVFSRTRWWWTAAVISSDGIGARFSSQSRSDSTMIRAPAAIALETLVRSCSIASASAGAAAVDVEVAGDPDGGEAGQVAVVVDVQDLGELVVVDDRERQEHLPAGRRGGLRAGSAPGRRCGPRLVTSSSRMASSGGLVTWANSWPK